MIRRVQSRNIIEKKINNYDTKRFTEKPHSIKTIQRIKKIGNTNPNKTKKIGKETT